MRDQRPAIVTLRSEVPGLLSRVQRMRQVLQEWLEKGIPHDKLASVPRSLTEARKWKDPELHIYPIGSPNDFTTKHPLVGTDVQAIASLLTKLRDKTKRVRPRRRTSVGQSVISASEIEQALSALISQWQMADQEARKQRVRADTAERHRDIARAESRAKDDELAELRRRLHGGLIVVR